MTEPVALRFQTVQYRALMASEQVWVVAACFNEAEVISVFDRAGHVALPDVDHLLLIDD